MDMALSYDVETRTTSGLLIYPQESPYPLHELVSLLKQCSEMTLHPLLLPCLVYNAWFTMLAGQYNVAHIELRDKVQQPIGFMRRYFSQEVPSERPPILGDLDYEELQRSHNNIYETLVLQHGCLCNALTPFVNDLGTNTWKALEDSPETCSFQKTRADADVRAYLLRLKRKTDVEINHRSLLIGKIWVQFHVLRELMRQRDHSVNMKISRGNAEIADINTEIARATKKDSSAMKSLALITIIFLPATTIAVST